MFVTSWQTYYVCHVMTNILAHDVTLIILVHTVVYFQELTWGMFLCALKRKRFPHFCNLWLVIVKATLRDISCYFWIMVLISIVSSVSLNSNELDNNFNLHKNCLMPMSSLFISKKDYLAIGWLLIITFDVVRSRKCEFPVYYLKKIRFSFDNLTHVVFWTKGELV